MMVTSATTNDQGPWLSPVASLPLTHWLGGGVLVALAHAALLWHSPFAPQALPTAHTVGVAVPVTMVVSAPLGARAGAAPKRSSGGVNPVRSPATPTAIPSPSVRSESTPAPLSVNPTRTSPEPMRSPASKALVRGQRMQTPAAALKPPPVSLPARSSAAPVAPATPTAVPSPRVRSESAPSPLSVNPTRTSPEPMRSPASKALVRGQRMQTPAAALKPPPVSLPARSSAAPVAPAAALVVPSPTAAAAPEAITAMPQQAAKLGVSEPAAEAANAEASGERQRGQKMGASEALSVGSAGAGATSGVANAQALRLANPKPLYPLSSRRLGEEGVVELKALVLEDGRVGDVALVQSSGYARLDESALQAVRRWRYMLPAGARMSRQWLLVPIDFNLSDPA
jgi:periplasmic protein TonB